MVASFRAKTKPQTGHSPACGFVVVRGLFIETYSTFDAPSGTRTRILIGFRDRPLGHLSFESVRLQQPYHTTSECQILYNVQGGKMDTYWLYEMKCIPTGKTYIGRTIKNPCLRWAEHFVELRNGISQCPLLQMAWQKHPCLSDWQFHAIKQVDGRTNAKHCEAALIEHSRKHEAEHKKYIYGQPRQKTTY
jgi:GIY-YIG catalytic domain